MESQFDPFHEESHKEQCRRFNREWYKNKVRRRIHNVQIAHGYITTSNGKLYVSKGIPRPSFNK